VDVYVEPSVRPRRLVVVGATPVAEALARTAVAAGYDVVRIVESEEQRDLDAQAAASGWALAPLESLSARVADGGPATAAVVASQGHYDEQALEVILQSRAVAYVGLVASRKRGATVKASLEQQGIIGADVLHVPAGLDLGARTAPEVAIAILAEIVQSRPDQALDAAPREQQNAAAAHPTAVDPVCHMDVEIATARHTADVKGTRYYFCCARCRTLFETEPARYLASRS
jgi:xanthine dehydrogenase accessory factor